MIGMRYVALAAAAALAVVGVFVVGNNPQSPELPDAPVHDGGAPGTHDKTVNIPAGHAPTRDIKGLAGKVQRTRAAAVERTGLSADEINRSGDTAIAAFYDQSSSPAFMNDLHGALTDTYGKEEADFLMSVMTMSDWQEIRGQLNERSAATGQDYTDLYARVGLAHGEISVEDLSRLAREGAGLPTDTINQLARHGRVDAIAELSNQGVLVDLNFRDPVTGENAVATFVRNVGYYPNKLDPGEAQAALQKLIGLGINHSFYDGTLDALDYALQVNPSNADLKLAMTSVLINQGAEISESHAELVANIADPQVRQRFEHLLDIQP